MNYDSSEIKVKQFTKIVIMPNTIPVFEFPAFSTSMSSTNCPMRYRAVILNEPPKIKTANYGCKKQGKNFGNLKTPEDCAIVANREGYNYYMFSTSYPNWGCRGCTKINGGNKNSNWDVYTYAADSD